MTETNQKSESRQECMICSSSVDSDDGTWTCPVGHSTTTDSVSLNNVEGLLDYSDVVCQSCIERYMESFIDHSSALFQLCPAPGCEHRIQFEEVEKLLSEKTSSALKTALEKRQKRMQEQIKNNEKKDKNGGLLSSPLIAISSKKLQLKQENDKQTMKWMRAYTQRCPRCFTTSSRNGGCDHMTCALCLENYCWSCGKSYDDHDTCQPNYFLQDDLDSNNVTATEPALPTNARINTVYRPSQGCFSCFSFSPPDLPRPRIKFGRKEIPDRCESHYFPIFNGGDPNECMFCHKSKEFIAIEDSKPYVIPRNPRRLTITFD